MAYTCLKYRQVLMFLKFLSITRLVTTMAWTCSGRSQTELIENLVKTDIIKTLRVKEAMLATDRSIYMPQSFMEYSYSDAPQSIGYDQTISAPHMVGWEYY